MPMQKAIDFLHKVEEGLLVFLLAAMTLVTFTQVVMRYAFNAGFIWALELVTFLFAWLVIMGVSYGIRIHSHIGVDAFVKLFPDTAQRVLGLIAISAGLAYSGMMAYGGFEEAYFAWEIELETLDLKWPMWMPLSVTFIGFSLACIRLLELAWDILKGGKGGLIGDESEEALQQFANQDDDDQAETKR